MKKFKFFALAFAALSFAACSDDALDGKGGSSGSIGDGTPAYLTISFSANSSNSSRSTADDANNNGDEHSTDNPATGEDSGHHNAGTANEQAVDKVLVVVVPTNGGNVNYAQLYNVSVDATANEDGSFTVQNGTRDYVNDEAIELTTGKYNVVVVANPVSDLTQGIEADLNTGISNSNAVENLYTKITTGDYKPEEADYNKIAVGQALSTEQDAKFRVMMANKELNSDLTDKTYTVELKEENTKDEPAVAHIEVERVFSKITFRPQANDSYVYEVPVRAGEVEAKTVPAAINVAAEGSTASYEYRELNVALDAANNEVYVLWEQKQGDPSSMEFKGVYAPTGEEQNVTLPGGGTDDVEVYTELEASTSEGDGKYVVKDTQNPQASLVYQSDETGVVDHWYVRLEGYALVNLSKNVYYVRHTTDNLGQSPFGTLNGTNYLYTPYWSEKNDDANIKEDDNGNLIFVDDTRVTPNAPISQTWFYNTLAQVSEESKTLKIGGTTGNLTFTKGDDGTIPADYYQAMPGTTTYNPSGSDAVTGDDHYNQTGEGVDNTPAIGNFMAYCFENSTDIDHQMHGISTGISFVARIYKNENCDDQSKIGTLYRYNNHLFESLEDIQKSYGANFMSSKFNELVEQEKTPNGTITKADLEELANFDAEGDAKDGETIYLYQDGLCYYYTTEIKHFDNGDNASLGNMEFAIMRNNIYSLAVTSINQIGDPFVDPSPNKPNENPEVKAALDVEVKIVPWIVRYNDIEF